MTHAAPDSVSAPDRLLPLDEALKRLQETLRPVVAPERAPLREAAGRILAADIVAAVDHPGAAVSAMDGYAVRHADLSADAPVTLPVSGRAAAGHPLPHPLTPGTTARIFTGAVMPAGADTVVMQEDVTEAGAGRVTLPAGTPPGRHVRTAGGDFHAGATVLTAGRRLRPPDIALAAAAGQAHLSVFERLRIGVFSTGDEVVEPGRPLPPGGLYDSNRHGMLALAEAMGAAVTDLGTLPDDRDRITAALNAAAEDHHVLITSGGVSVGGEDHVRDAVAALGTLQFWRLAIKPGKPTALGAIRNATFIGLPGNPVAALVTFVLIARPVVLGLGGARMTAPRRYPVPAGFAHENTGNRRAFLRAWIEDTAEGPRVRLFRSQDSAMTTSLGAATGLVDLPAGSYTVAPGQPVDYLPLNEVLS